MWRPASLVRDLFVLNRMSRAVEEHSRAYRRRRRTPRCYALQLAFDISICVAKAEDEAHSMMDWHLQRAFASNPPPHAVEIMIA